MLFRHCERRAASRAACTAGKSSAARVAMMAISTNSSISVKPARGECAWRWLGSEARLPLLVAAQAGANDVFPVGQPAAAAGNDVIEAELLRGKAMTAVLAAVLIAKEDVSAVELNHILRVQLVPQQANHPRHLNLEIHRPDPV